MKFQRPFGKQAFYNASKCLASYTTMSRINRSRFNTIGTKKRSAEKQSFNAQNTLESNTLFTEQVKQAALKSVKNREKPVSIPFDLQEKLNLIAFPRLTPSTSPIAVHGGYKIQVSVIINRVPFNYEEPAYRTYFREYREKWRLRTNNMLDIDPSILFMKMSSNKFELSEETEIDTTNEDEKIKQKHLETEEKLQTLISSEGVIYHENAKYQTKSLTNRKSKKNKTVQYILDPNISNIYRCPWDLLNLLVWYRSPSATNTDGLQGSWHLPISDKKPGYSIRNTIQELCKDQLGIQFSPYLPSSCPVAHYIKQFPLDVHRQFGIKGRQVFVYRAYWVPGRPNAEISHSSVAQKFGWIRSREVEQMLPPLEAKTFRNCTLLN